VAKGNTGRFLALFSTLINAAFSYGGVEMVAVAAGEAENRRFYKAYASATTDE